MRNPVACGCRSPLRIAEALALNRVRRVRYKLLWSMLCRRAAACLVKKFKAAKARVAFRPGGPGAS